MYFGHTNTTYCGFLKPSAPHIVLSEYESLTKLE
jgi:hypothetical protein